MTPDANMPAPVSPAFHVCLPLNVWLDGRRHVVRSLDDAIDLLRNGPAHPLAAYSELLVHQLETAVASDDLQTGAWRAFQTWTDVLRLAPRTGARQAA